MSKFIDQIATGDAVGAKETMSDMLSAKAFEALDARKQQIASTLFGGMQVEEVEDLEEGTMTGITLGKKVKNDEGGYDQDVHHKGKKIGSVGSYSHRTGKRYGMSHDASGDMSAGARDHKEALDDLRDTHAAYLKSMKKEDVEQE